MIGVWQTTPALYMVFCYYKDNELEAAEQNLSNKNSPPSLIQ